MRRQKKVVQRPGPICPRCGGFKFARSRGLRGLWRNLAFVVLCLFLLIPGLVYFAVRQELFFTCRACGAHFTAADLTESSNNRG
jgi:hypothetical protein